MLPAGCAAFLVRRASHSSQPAAAIQRLPVMQAGGLSGEPLREEADAALRDMYRLTGGKLPIIGCGGISTGRHVYQRIRAGERQCIRALAV